MPATRVPTLLAILVMQAVADKTLQTDGSRSPKRKRLNSSATVAGTTQDSAGH